MNVVVCKHHGSMASHCSCPANCSCREYDPAFWNCPKVPMEKQKPGYHMEEIPKGEMGHISKLFEELRELEDADRQGSRVMVLNEVCDLYGALEAFVERNFPGFKMNDVREMSDVTKRAFMNGRRK